MTKDMNRETIEKAAYLYAESIPQSDERKEYSREDFMAGAEWRINSVWHDGTVSCQSKRKALVIFKNGNAAVYKDLRDLSYEMLWGEVERFAYVDDLLPRRKETSDEKTMS